MIRHVFNDDALPTRVVYGRDTNGSIFMEVADKRLDMTDLLKDATTEEIREATVENPDGRYFSLHTGFQRLILQKRSQKWPKKVQLNIILQKLGRVAYLCRVLAPHT